MSIVIPTSKEPGIYPATALTNQQYHECKELSSTQLVTFVAESAAHFRAAWPVTNPDKERKTTQALTFGSAAHSYLLEPDAFHAQYKVLPEGTNLRTNAGKELRDTLQAEAEALGGAVLSADEKADIVDMAEALARHRVRLGKELVPLRELFKHGKPEVSFFWRDPVTGMPCRCRTDWVINTSGLKLIIDYKTTRSAKRAIFAKDAGSMYYWMRQAFYVDGVHRGLQAMAARKGEVYDLADAGNRYSYLLVAQEKTGPKLAQAFTYDPDREALGRELYRETLLRIQGCCATGNWPGYSEDLQQLEIPSWVLGEHPNLAEIAQGHVVPTHLAEDGC